MSVLDDLKNLLEVDVEETIFDAQLLLYANSGIAYLKNNGIPVERIGTTNDVFAFQRELTENKTSNAIWHNLRDDDYEIVLAWLHLYCLQRFDRTLMTSAYKTTQNWIDSEMTNLIYQLKVRYDYEE